MTCTKKILKLFCCCTLTIFKFTSITFRIILSGLVRCLYLSHTFYVLLTIDQIEAQYEIFPKGYQSILLLIIIPMLLELIYNLVFKQGDSYRWWSPATFLYLLAIVFSTVFVLFIDQESKYLGREPLCEEHLVSEAFD